MPYCDYCQSQYVDNDVLFTLYNNIIDSSNKYNIKNNNRYMNCCSHCYNNNNFYFYPKSCICKYCYKYFRSKTQLESHLIKYPSHNIKIGNKRKVQN